LSGVNRVSTTTGPASPEAGDERQRIPGRGNQVGDLTVFLENLEDYAFITFDLHNRVTTWNAGAERILGYSEREALGLPGSQFFTPEDVQAHAEEHEMADARRFGRAADERWHMRKNGTRFWGSGVMSPLLDNAGVIRGYGKVFRDLTEQKLAQDRIRESEEHLRLFVENVTDYALMLADAEGRVSGWNRGAERIFGYRAEEVRGKPYAEFFTPEDIAAGDPEEDFEEARRTGRSERERWMVRKDSSRFWGRWVTNPIRDASGVLRGYAKVLHDETDRKQQQEGREAAAQQQRRYLESQVKSRGEDLDRTKEELRALAGSLLRAQEEERRRIARELHDDLLQRLAMLQVRVAQAAGTKTATASSEPDLKELREDIAAISANVRTISHQLHPAMLDDFGLAPALRRLAEEFQTARAQPVDFVDSDLPDDIPRDVETVFYRIAQEALRNIAKHGDTDTVRVTLSGREGRLTLEIVDAGPGFDVSSARAAGGLGIISMQERAQLIGAVFRIISIAGQGTTVKVDVSLNRSTDA
jgi:PAS domain S-box-containing protein